MVPEKFQDLMEKRIFAGLATVMPDGAPQVTPVWIDYDGENVIFNTAEGRQKDKNLQREPRVSLMLVDPENPYRYLEVRGTVVERTHAGADDHINKMAKKYLDQDVYPFRAPGEVRVIYKIKPERFSSLG
ncbi:MAG: PPOX class F420-dependent oxidoreductase [Blastocatellia bacterium]|nr:PPOX class F420-dependent oxidoreductase [Blastocatellia bacterium]